MTAVAGILSMIAYSTSQRHREIGIRLALGGERRAILIANDRFTLVAVTVGLFVAAAAATWIPAARGTLLNPVEALRSE